MMDANFSLKRLMRKTELEAFRVFEEERVWVTEEEVALAAQQENKGKAKVSDLLQSSLTYYTHCLKGYWCLPNHGRQ